MPRKLIAEIVLKDRFTRAVGKVEKKLTHFTRRVGRLYKEMMSLKGLMYAMGGYTIIRVGKGFTDAATQMELFGNQLLMISRSAKEAKETLGYLREFARVSPLGTKDVIAAYIRMRAVGINPTIETMKTMGGVALLMGRTLLEVTNAMISKHKRTAREYGVILDQMGKTAILSSGIVVKEVEKRDMAIRQALIEVWEERFPKAIEIAARTAKAKVELLMSNVVELQAAVGELLMKQYKGFLVETAILFEKAREHSGKIAASIKFLIFMFEIIWNVAKHATLSIATLTMTAWNSGKSILWFFDGLFMGILNTAKAIPLAVKRLLAGYPIEAIGGLIDDMHTLFDERFAESGKMAVQDYDILMERLSKYTHTVESDWAKILEHARGVKETWGKVPGPLGGKLPTGLKEFPDPLAGKLTPEQLAAAAAAEKKAFEAMVKNRIASLEIAKGEMGIVERMITQKERQIQLEKELTEAQAKRRERIDIAIQNVEQFGSAINNLGTSFTALSQAKRSAALDKANEEINAMKVSEKVKDKLRKKAEAQNKSSARKEKAIAISLAIMNQALAIGRIFTATQPNIYAKFVLAGIVSAIMGIQVATIRRQRLASGNMYTSNAPAIMGERGPEAVFMPPGSRVYNATQTKYNYGSPQISLNVNVSGSADSGTVNAIKDTLSDFAGKLTDAVRYGYISKDQLGMI